MKLLPTIYRFAEFSQVQKAQPELCFFVVDVTVSIFAPARRKLATDSRTFWLGFTPDEALKTLCLSISFDRRQVFRSLRRIEGRGKRVQRRNHVYHICQINQQTGAAL